MFKTIIIVALVFFAAGFIAWKGMAKEEKPVIADEEIDWDEYGHIDAGEISLGLTLDPDFKTTLTLTNTSKRRLYIFAHTTGRGGQFFNDRLRVSVNGKAVDYQGPMYKIAMGKNWFEALEPGAVFTNIIDLQEYYPFDAKKGDAVHIEFDYKTEKAVADLTL